MANTAYHTYCRKRGCPDVGSPRRESPTHSAALKLDFKPIPVEKIGLYQDEYR